MERMQERTTREERANETETPFQCWECGDACAELVQAPWSGRRLLVGTCCLELREPECECAQTDVDLFDAAGCELHDPRSRYNRALTLVDKLDRYESEVA